MAAWLFKCCQTPGINKHYIDTCTFVQQWEHMLPICKYMWFTFESKAPGHDRCLQGPVAVSSLLIIGSIPKTPVLITVQPRRKWIVKPKLWVQRRWLYGSFTSKLHVWGTSVLYIQCVCKSSSSTPTSTLQYAHSNNTRQTDNMTGL